jgi:branched-chain amino acid transport system substrate-binding protein
MRIWTLLGLGSLLAACPKGNDAESTEKGKLEVSLLSEGAPATKGEALGTNRALRFTDTATSATGKLVFVLTNTGPGPLKLRTPVLISTLPDSTPVPEFKLKPYETCPGKAGAATDLAKGECSRLTVEFSSASIGGFADTLSIDSDGSSGEVRFNLSATSVRAKPKAAGGEYGVTNSEVVLGQSAAFSGPSLSLGMEVWRGASAAFDEINAAGGVHGRKIVLKVSDDAYEEAKSIPSVLKLVNDEQVFALFTGVGTPTIAKALPVVKRYYDDEKLFYFASFTGAQVQRDPPFDRLAFNVRASYAQETETMVRALVAAGKKKIAVFTQDDGYGKSGLAGVKKALKYEDLPIVAQATYPRGLQFDQSMAFHVGELKKGAPDAILCVAAYQAAAALVRDVRNSGWNVPIFNVSFVGSDQMVKLLRKEEEKTKKKYVTRLFNTQVVPPYSATHVPLVRLYREAINTYKPTAPAGVGDGNYVPAQPYTYGSLEGYLNAQVFAKVLEKVGPKLTREAFIAAAEGMGKFDVGLDAPIEFSSTRHQALDQVWLTYPDGAEWKIVDDLGRMLK